MTQSPYNVDLLGRYEGKDDIGITHYVTFEATSRWHELRYDYGVQGMPPKESKIINYAELTDRVTAVLEKGMVKILDIEDIKSEAVTNAFSLAEWAEQ